MKRILLALSLGFAIAARADLDNTQTFDTSDGFWDTTAYENVARSSASAASDFALDTRLVIWGWSNFLLDFNTDATGFLWIFR